MKKKKHTVSPEAAKILEQYRNAGKPQPTSEGDSSAPPGNEPAARPNAAPPPSASTTRQRSGTRGK